MKGIKFTLTALTFCWAILAQASPIVDHIKISQKGLAAPLTYSVFLPASYNKNTDKTYFVLFDLHPRSKHFISGMQDWLSHNGEWPWPETIVVTPSDYHEEFAKMFSELEKDPTQSTILDVIQNGILNALDEKYRTNGFRIFSGFMSNGAMGLYALMNRPNMFNAYLISTPTLSNDFAHIVSDAPEKLRQPFSGIKFLHLTIGNHHFEQPHRAAVKQFKETLREYAPDNLQWSVDDDEQHYYMSRPIITLLNGIERLFDDLHNPLLPDSPIAQAGPQSIIDYYHRLSNEKYGFDVSAEPSLKALAESWLPNKPDKAIALYTKITELYPDSAYAFYSLANAYAQLGKIDNAVKIQTQALEKSKNMIKWHQNKHQEYLDRFISLQNETTKQAVQSAQFN